ncbi:Qat anti-phage system associated protein QatB [Aliivibrio sp.]|uniref:Qat anti-phage system associated protein QatB n=1 Tax=Aliivibrio sp. TaxID=1872443 RepID=UPI003D2F1E9B
MGTSTSNKGPNSKNPLVPTWLGGGDGEPLPQQGDGEPLPQQGDGGDSSGEEPKPQQGDSGDGSGEEPKPPQGDDGAPDNVPKPLIKPETGQRFRYPRSEMNRYFRTGSTGAMKNSISRYVKNTGGKSSAVKRMGRSTKVAGNLLSFLTDVSQRGSEAVAKSFNLSLKPNETADELLLRVSDQICDVSTSNIPDAVTRNAYIETVIEMTTTLGITDLDSITPEQIQTSLGCFIGKSVTERVINDIGNNIVAEKANPEQLQKTLRELGGYIEGCASDAISRLTSNGMDIMDIALVGKINEIYTSVFEILESVGGE